MTMMHFTSPAWLIRDGGWESEETVDAFAKYCAYIAEKLGDLFTYVCTINEANMGLQMTRIAERFQRQMMHKAAMETPAEGTVQVGWNITDMMANREAAAKENMEIFGTETPQIFVSARTPEGDRLVMRAHQAAKAAMKAARPGLQIGITLSLHDIQSVPGGETYAAKMWEEEFGHYISYIKDDDFFGLQNYTRGVYDADGILPVPAGAETTQMEYEFYPQGLEHVIRKVYEELKLPIIVTENGIATERDDRRIAYIDTALAGVQKCMADGIPVKGYLHWSLLDNFEWQKGYDMTFGLVAVDRSDNMKRIPKKSLYRLGKYMQE